MKVTRLYTGDDNQSHFQDIEIELSPSGVGLLSEKYPATGVIFRETAADYDLDFHNAPRKQFVVCLDASVEVTIGDGTSRVFGPGDIFLAEDVTGQGHISKAVNGQVRHSLFIPIEED
ncbi:MAG: hypothetical protein HQ478_02220 [Chloroflexi bacterium]|nr:hypothetical protein [Chloroflexota bacterium]